ncbi:hypothetical protein C0995_011737 [Termitomyces sp. Mi166|nr:hypothetical protein C0995_011737 [Termitomyces sp. Mi166\
MSRHNRKVPTSFYHRFARDARALSDKYAGGRLVSVLEGGYSDRALTSGAMAHLSGLVDEAQFQGKVDEEWWSIENLIKLEKATKKRRGGRPSLTPAADEPWLERTVEIFQSLDTNAKALSPAASSRSLVPPSTMTLRDRKSGNFTPSASPRRGADRKPSSMSPSSSLESSSGSSSSEGEVSAPKKLPRVILRLGPDPSLPSRP